MTSPINTINKPPLNNSIKNKLLDKNVKLENNTLIKGELLEKIPYSDRPLPQGGNIVYLDHQQFQEKFSCEYSESLFGDPNELRPYLENGALIAAIKSKPDKPPEASIRERLKNPLNCLVICNMNECGYGVFSSSDIPKNTVLGIYSGVIGDGRPYSEKDPYAYRWCNVQGFSLPLKTISSKIKRGITGFFQHLPIDPIKHKNYLKDELSKKFPQEILKIQGIDLDSFIDNEVMAVSSSIDHEPDDTVFKNLSAKKQLATSNVTVIETLIDGIPTVVCWTIYGIKKGEQVGFSYGDQYWKAAKINPRYFTNDGTIIPLEEYKIESSSLVHVAEKSPFEFYEQGIKEYKKNNYDIAIKLILQAQQIFKINEDKFLLELGTCYSTLASCYRNLNNYKNATSSCEQAIFIFSVHNKQKMTEVLKKYRQCLELSNESPKNLYDHAINLYKNKHYYSSIEVLKYALTRFELNAQSSDTVEQATCHSTLASCYREVGNKIEAIKHAELALEIRKKIYGLKHKLVEQAEIKLKDLTNL